MNELLKYRSDQYAQVYGEEYIKKMNYLRDVITTYETRPRQFNVFDFEAGLGKSYVTTQIIDEYLENKKYLGGNRNFLIVKPFREDVEQMEEYLSRHNEEEIEYNVFDEEYKKVTTRVIGIHSDNWGLWKKKLSMLPNVDVIIITHARYMNLCLDQNLKQYFTENRHTLIIDEKIIFPVYTFSEQLYNNIQQIFPYSLKRQLFDVCDNLLSVLAEMKKRKLDTKCHTIKPKIRKKVLDSFKASVKANLKEIENDEDKREVERFVQGLDLWYSQPCMFNAGNLSITNPLHRHWGLKNNIILDASADIDGYCRLNDIHFELRHQTSIIEHNNSRFYKVNFNSAKSNINKYRAKFLTEICEKIKQYKNGQVLIVCHKDNEESIKNHIIKSGITSVGIDNREGDHINKDIVINHYGNLVGKNHYKDFKQVWIIGTPNIPYEQYLIHYIQYSWKKDTGRKGIDIVGGRFKNQLFKRVQEGYIAKEIYQSIKRIQRNTAPQGDFFICIHDDEILSKILAKMKGASDNLSIIEMDFMKEIQTERVNKKRSDFDAKIDALRNYLLKMEPGTKEDKKDIAIKLNINQKQFGFRYLNHNNIKLLDGKYIKIHRTHIERLLILSIR